ncbi:Fic family protein [Desulfuromonas acetoxidans]|uniref:Filamentation induced by cAMP protein Fic n=1 Tax=Desulfuromonas acetoxidans (strain DSM 684 / 11070) TaxID=281689 RepID=Q1K458_DESA6|nr:Fic/DOC family N-terminal domain-containing protein [Desulfuromonas acetoxidans]EAT17245.1 filamentation induced by cAMP protein Fic [Desulfuromonas acetoxidans DSM 684]MBF0645893.1 Fic family protein [Desulfuromonas acetoxidans]NVD24165.1 Fic family protein [Desulfuromonas acetoxidans]NVE15062.1 Fic family protein [Desulfuromonas acetoxidans]
MEHSLENAVGYHYGKFPPENLDYGRLVQPLVEATDALARYDQMLKNMHNSEILLAPLRNQEAVISSRMEGTVSTMDEILQYEADYSGESGEVGDVRSEVIETILYQRALKATQQAMSDGYGLSKSLIKSIHQRLLSLGRGAKKSPGQFKTEQNYLADKFKKNILFVPISPESLESGLDHLFEYIHNSTEPVLIKTGITHVEFEALHPFKDGNGRIGRMLITLMMWNCGLISAPHFYISGFLEENKDTYIDTMRSVSETGDWESWCVFFLKALEQQAIRNLEIAENIKTLYEEMKSKFSELLSSKWSVNALDFVFTNPVFRNNKFTNNSGIPSGTAARFTRILLDEGLIITKAEASGRRPALYSFEPLMQLVRV